MKFRDLNKISTGHIKGKKYYGVGEYSHCVWQILREEQNPESFYYKHIFVKHILPVNDWSRMPHITVFAKHLSNREFK